MNETTEETERLTICGVSGSFCLDCNNTGYKLRSNGKIPVEETIGIRAETRFESLPISEPLIKCSCGGNYR